VDLFPAFIEKLEAQADALNLDARIQTYIGDMTSLPFGDEELDIIWSEGAIYNMGFEAGVRQWRKYLKPGGFLAVSEIIWLTADRPAEIDAFWKAEYPEIDLASGKLRVLEDNGYAPVGYFVLPPESWIENYFRPLEARFPAFLERHRHSEAAQGIVQAQRDEIALHAQYQAYFSYGFFVARKI
jgi:SAM-dependent methyltransferase